MRWRSPWTTAGSYDGLGCGGNGIRWTVAKALGMRTMAWTDFDIGNGSLTVIRVRPDESVRLAVHSDVGHIRVEKRTFAGSGGRWKVATAGMK